MVNRRGVSSRLRAHAFAELRQPLAIRRVADHRRCSVRSSRCEHRGTYLNLKIVGEKNCLSRTAAIRLEWSTPAILSNNMACLRAEAKHADAPVRGALLKYDVIMLATRTRSSQRRSVVTINKAPQLLACQPNKQVVVHDILFYQLQYRSAGLMMRISVFRKNALIQ